MTKTEIYEPKQKRSIEKKNHIIQTGLQLMVEKGYHHTTTDDIAAAAGVSTGIIYRYFKDKHDILLSGLSYAFHQMYEQNLFDWNMDSSANMRDTIEKLLDHFLTIHTENTAMHEELEAMRHSDTDVSVIYEHAETAIVRKITEAMHQNGNQREDLFERTYAVFHLIEGYCHMYIRTLPAELSLARMKEVTLQACCSLLE